MNLKKNSLIGLMLLLCFYSNSQEAAQELTGNIIYLDRCNEQANPVRNAFDNNVNTFFSSCAPSGNPFCNWVGLDLGEKHIITKLAYCCARTESNYVDRLTLGVFEGANNPDFGDAIPLFIIPGMDGYELTSQEIECTRGFRYVRFVFPTPQENGKSIYLSELKFYGYKGTGTDDQLPRIANIPTISIHTANTEDITNKETYIKGIVSVISDDGKNIYTDSLDIRGRGNNSWTYPKKPYRMKLFNKASLLGFPAKEKNWTLINSYGDKTMMRNLLGFDLSRRMELPYTPAGKAVNVFLNGDYRGCYQLCDQIEVAKGRVDVEEMKKTDVTEPNIRGGYLLEIDAYAHEEPEMAWFNSPLGQTTVTIKYPKDDEIVTPQRDFIINYFNSMEAALRGNNYTDKVNGFRKYIDTPSFLRLFLTSELNGNTDTFWSVYLYKKRNDDLFYFSPIWDLDLAFENDDRTYPINTRHGNQWLYKTGSAVAGMRDFVDRILSDQDASKEMENIYAYYRNSGVISKEALSGAVDEYARQLEQSQQLNFKRWPIMNTRVHQNPVVHGSYEAEVANVRNYIEERVDWMDKKLNYVPSDIMDADDNSKDKMSIETGKNVLRITNVSEILSVRIVDVMGRVVIPDQKIQSDFACNLPSGTYLVMTTKAKGDIQVHKCLVP